MDKKEVYDKVFHTNKIIDYSFRKELTLERDGKRYWILLHIGTKKNGHPHMAHRVYNESNGKESEDREEKEILSLAKQFWRKHR